MASCRGYREAVRVLQNNKVYGESFQSLNESTVRGWYDRGVFNKVKKKVYDRWKQQAPVERGVGSGRQYIFEGKLGLEKKIKSTLEGMRTAGIVVNGNVAVAIIRGLVIVDSPELLGKYGLSHRWCRRWITSNLNWSFRRGTTSGQKLPLDWRSQCDKMLMRAAVVAAKRNVIHPALIINWDQTGMNLVPSHRSSFDIKGKKQVPIAKLDDKRQITAVVASNAMGELLPVQLVWTGVQYDKKTGERGVASIPKDAVSKKIMKEEKWHMTQTDNHWSSEETMKDYITSVVHPFVQSKFIELKLKPANSHAILVLDCWGKQIHPNFMGWLKTNYPNYHPIVIPANCTGVMQPADVFLNKPLKDSFRNQFTRWSTAQYSEQIREGAEPAQMKLDTSIKTLKPLVTEWLYTAWKQLKQEKRMIRTGWDSLGFFKILDKAFQRDSLIQMSEENEEEQEEGKEEEQEEEKEEAKGEVTQAYEEGVAQDESDCSDQDEDVDVITSLANCLQECEIKPTSSRSSSRLQQNKQKYTDGQLALSIAEDELDGRCYLDDDEYF